MRLEPETLDTDNGLYTATVHVRLQDMRNGAKKQALAHFGEIIGLLQKYYVRAAFAP